MPIILIDENEIQTIHTSERLEIQLSSAKEIVEEMRIKIWFNVETRLPNGALVSQPYWDGNNPLELSCEDDIELADAMRVIQQKIGEARYKQITAPPEVPELVESPGMIPPIENS